jgi:UDP-N-acetylmuramyl pentapeptide phosphotransferase/UDP-N-acetylglucosamine-1-phosphate transferase
MHSLQAALHMTACTAACRQHALPQHARIASFATTCMLLKRLLLSDLQVYMVMLTIFSTNSINILAGVNGLEAGQTFVVACAILTHNLLSVAGYAGGNTAVRDGHLFSAYLMIPLAMCTLGLLVFNWWALGSGRQQQGGSTAAESAATSTCTLHPAQHAVAWNSSQHYCMPSM